jgi:nitrogen regulatory protein PII 2
VKEIIAIIRPKKVTATKDALAALGVTAMTAEAVLGRGKQRGIANEVSFPIEPDLLSRGKSGGMKFVPKRYLTIVVNNELVERVIKTIVKINQTALVGDGKIFVCPIEEIMRVRTGERGTVAVN